MSHEQAVKILGPDTAASVLKDKESGATGIAFFLQDIPASKDLEEIAKLYCAAIVALTEGWWPPIAVPLKSKIFFTVQKHKEDYRKALERLEKICS